MSSMDRKFPFKIEGESFDWPEQKVQARNLLEFAKDKAIPTAQHEVEKLTLKGSQETIYSDDDWVDLSQDNDFTLGLKEEEKVYRFKVNGEELESSSDKLIALDIMKMAQEKGVPLPDKPENFILQVVQESSNFSPNDLVDLSKYNEFILIPTTSTSVASIDRQCPA